MAVNNPQNSFFLDEAFGSRLNDHTRTDQDRNVGIPRTKIQGWVDQLQQAANEAGDEELLALESDLLDLRDELGRLIH